MTVKQFFTNPITITAGSILIIVGIAWIGKKYWGWFAGNNTVPSEGLYDANGNPINGGGTQKKKGCSPECLEAYPEGSIYYGYYYCRTNCAVFERATESQQRPDLMFNVSPTYQFTGRPTVDTGGSPNPDGGPRPNPTAIR